MKASFFLKKLLLNQEICETGKNLIFNDLLILKSITVFIKNKKCCNEEYLLLKVSLLQLLFYKKIFFLISFKNSQLLNKFPIGGFMTLRKNLDFFLDIFFKTFFKKYNSFFKHDFFFLKLVFIRKSVLIRHFFRNI